MEYVLPLHDTDELVLACIIPAKNPQTTTRLPTGAKTLYLILIFNTFASTKQAEKSNPDEIMEVISNAKNEFELAAKGIE